jgi:hypothetical protein
MFRVTNNLKRLVVYWVAIVSIATGTFAPVISQAISKEQSSNIQTMEICTSSGAQAIHVNQDDSAPSISLESHCPYCLAHTFFVPSINQQLSFSVPLTSTTYPPLFYQATSPQFAWVKLPSQAPPL